MLKYLPLLFVPFIWLFFFRLSAIAHKKKSDCNRLAEYKYWNKRYQIYNALSCGTACIVGFVISILVGQY